MTVNPLVGLTDAEIEDRKARALEDGDYVRAAGYRAEQDRRRGESPRTGGAGSRYQMKVVLLKAKHKGMVYAEANMACARQLESEGLLICEKESYEGVHGLRVRFNPEWDG